MVIIPQKNKRILTNELQVYLLRNNSPNGKQLVDAIVFKNPVNGKRKTSYINDVIAPIYNHIVIEVLDPLLHTLQSQPPLAHKITTTIKDINNPAKVKYCSFGRYSDVDIQDEHGFTTTVLHGGLRKDKKRAKRRINDGCIPEKDDKYVVMFLLVKPIPVYTTRNHYTHPHNEGYR
jgi:hypothetical protein